MFSRAFRAKPRLELFEKGRAFVNLIFIYFLNKKKILIYFLIQVLIYLQGPKSES